MNDFNYGSADETQPRPGPYLAKVVNHLDNTYMGALEVELLHPVGNNPLYSELHRVKYMSPFYGVTSVQHISEDNDYNGTQKSYGMWFIPPDVGTTVMVIFIDGDPTKGYWFGCVPDYGMNFMVPGLAATQKVVEDVDPDKADRFGRVPVAEYNKKVDEEGSADPNMNSILKPRHPFTDVLDSQGLLLDDIRGITSSSARREVPSMVFGISTPGPRDRQDGAPKGIVGRGDSSIPDAFVSRLGGTTFVFDDGNPGYLRKTPASEGPPEYANLDDGETDGDTTIPHNELVRLRTRTGHQILLHNSEDLIYITNSRGTAWIEITSDGKIDVYAEDSINVRTGNDLNFYASRDINIEARRNLNIKVNEEMHTHVVGSQKLIVTADQKIHVTGAVDTTYDSTFTHHVKEDVNILFDSNYLQHVLGSVDKKFDGSLKTKVDGSEDRVIGGAVTINSGSGYEITAGGTFQVKASGTNIDGGQIHFNSGNFGGSTAAEAAEAAEAELPQRLKLHKLPIETGEYDEELLPPSIMRRVPVTEPYPHHENLDPVKFRPDQTDRDIDGRYEDTDAEQTNDQADFTESILQPPDLWQQYTTNTDPFKIDPPPASAEEQQDQQQWYE